MINGETSTFKRLLAAMMSAGAIIAVAILGLSLITSTENYTAPPELVEAVANDKGFEWPSYCIITIPKNKGLSDAVMKKYSEKECFGPLSDNPAVFTVRDGYIWSHDWLWPEPDEASIIKLVREHYPLIVIKGVKVTKPSANQ